MKKKPYRTMIWCRTKFSFANLDAAMNRGSTNVFLLNQYFSRNNFSCNLSCSINTYKFDKIWERCKLESTNMKLWKIGNNNIYKIYNISIWHYCLLMQNEVLCILHYFGYSDHKFCTLPSAFKLLLKSCKNKSSSISNRGELQWLSNWNAMAEYILKWLLKYQWNE